LRADGRRGREGQRRRAGQGRHETLEVLIMPQKPGDFGLYANIHAKRERIAAGSGEKMRKPGSAGAPTAKAFKESAKTAKKGK
jgi:hypothetical protein